MQDTTLKICDQPLVDIHPITGNLVDWSRYKRKAERMAESYRRIEEIDPSFIGRAYKLSECGNWLQFKRFVQTNDKELFRANFCRQRLCPMCSWRRSLKIFGQTSQIMDQAEKDGYRFLFVTLTMRNVDGADLAQAIDNLFASFGRLLHRKAYSRVINGWMRCLEVTHNINPKSDWFHTYHPHIHAIWVVKDSYFRKREQWIAHSQLIQDWRKCARLSYDPSVDIRAIKKGDKGAIKEVSKYATKPGEILVEDEFLTDSAVWTLDNALAGRRLVEYGGLMKRIKADLRLDDVEDGDLVNVDGEKPLRDDLAYVLETFSWHAGLRQFYLNV